MFAQDIRGLLNLLLYAVWNMFSLYQTSIRYRKTMNVSHQALFGLTSLGQRIATRQG
jgi:hypothetical protein